MSKRSWTLWLGQPLFGWTTATLLDVSTITIQNINWYQRWSLDLEHVCGTACNMWYIEYIHVMYKNKKINRNHNKQPCIMQLWSILHQGDGRVRPGNGWMLVTTRGSLVDAVQNLEIGWHITMIWDDWHDFNKSIWIYGIRGTAVKME